MKPFFGASRHALLALLICLGAVAAAGPIAHPDPTAFDDHVREVLEAAQTDYRQAGGPRADAAAHGALGLVYHAHELLAPAAQAYSIAAELAPADARWPYYLGMIAAESGRLAEARTRFAASLEQNPYYWPAKLRLAQALIGLNRLPEAATMLTTALAEHPGQAALNAASGRLNQQLGQSREAIAQLQRALELQPTANALYFPLAMAYRDLGEADQARQLLERGGQRDVIVDDPLNQRLRSQSRSYSYFLKLGLQAAGSGDLSAAEGYLQTTLRIAPDNVYVLGSFARVLEAGGHLPRALEYNARALAVDPNYAAALEHRGVLLELSGDDPGAIGAYRAALARDAQLGDARRLLGNALMRAGEFSEAAAQFGILSAQQPTDNDLVLHYAAALYEAGECPPAAEILAGAVQQSQDAGTLLAYARVVAACPAASAAHRTQALTAMHQLYQVDPALHTATTLAMIEAAGGDFAAAEDYQAQAMFVAIREARQDLLESLKVDLEGYRQERLPQRPWQPDHPLSKPPPLTLADRR